MKDKSGNDLFPSTVLIHEPAFGLYRVFFTGGLNHTQGWIFGNIDGKFTFTPEEFKTLKTRKLARALYAYEGG